MSTMSFTVMVYLTISTIRTFKIPKSYRELRDHLIRKELSTSIGGRIILSDTEKKVDKILMKMKEDERNNSNPAAINFTEGYSNYKDKMRNSRIYALLKEMPKGAVLHAHSLMMLNAEDLLDLTYVDNLYICFSGTKIILEFSDKFPKKKCNETWQLLSDLRKRSDREKVDEKIKKQFCIVTSPANTCDADGIWRTLENTHRTIVPLLAYKPVFEKYIYKVLLRLHEDNVLYAEIRMTLLQLHKLDGKHLTYMESLRVYDKINKLFKKRYSDFIGIKIIVSMSRFKDIETIKSQIRMVIDFKKKLPHLIAGFDLVGQEDMGGSLYDLLPALYDVKNSINFYFHAGETNWSGTKIDENLLDAILLGTKRIGHGYALAKHPILLEMLKKKNIAIEVNVVSNNVLCLVNDVRNHPLAELLAQNMPVVLSSDDPGIWGADPLTTDFFVAFMGVASKRAGLKMLKQLALNSIKYSALDDDDKVKAYAIFNAKWETFTTNIIDNREKYEL